MPSFKTYSVLNLKLTHGTTHYVLHKGVGVATGDAVLAAEVRVLAVAASTYA
jgi:hypothetical protein